MKAKFEYWKYEAGRQARGVWRRYWPPAHIKALTAERDDWIVWCESAEKRLRYHRDLNVLALDLIVKAYVGDFEEQQWKAAALRWREDYVKSLERDTLFPF